MACSSIQRSVGSGSTYAQWTLGHQDDRRRANVIRKIDRRRTGQFKWGKMTIIRRRIFSLPLTEGGTTLTCLQVQHD